MQRTTSYLLLLISVLNKFTPTLHYLQTELMIQVDIKSNAYQRFMNMQVTFTHRLRAVKTVFRWKLCMNCFFFSPSPSGVSTKLRFFLWSIFINKIKMFDQFWCTLISIFWWILKDLRSNAPCLQAASFYLLFTVKSWIM